MVGGEQDGGPAQLDHSSPLHFAFPSGGLGVGMRRARSDGSLMKKKKKKSTRGSPNKKRGARQEADGDLRNALVHVLQQDARYAPHEGCARVQPCTHVHARLLLP